MKLYLSSKHLRFPTELSFLVGKAPSTARVSLIVNAFDNYPADRRNMHIANLTESLQNAGYKPAQLDLRGYIGQTKKLHDTLNKSDLIWVSGGNVFYLRYLLRQCGLDKSLKDLLENDLVYAGDSAGAAVLGHDLHGLDLLVDPTEAPEIIYDGLNITPFIILPHWGNERYQDDIANSKNILKKFNSKVITISDDQAYIVDGESSSVLG